MDERDPRSQLTHICNGLCGRGSGRLGEGVRRSRPRPPGTRWLLHPSRPPQPVRRSPSTLVSGRLDGTLRCCLRALCPSLFTCVRDHGWWPQVTRAHIASAVRGAVARASVLRRARGRQHGSRRPDSPPRQTHRWLRRTRMALRLSQSVPQFPLWSPGGGGWGGCHAAGPLRQRRGTVPPPRGTPALEARQPRPTSGCDPPRDPESDPPAELIGIPALYGYFKPLRLGVTCHTSGEFLSCYERALGPPGFPYQLR